MKKLFAMAVPILPGKTPMWKQFMKDLTTTYGADFEESRNKMGVRERSFFQSTPMGDIVIVTLEGEDPEMAFATFGQGTDKFTKWFVQQVKDIHGFDLTTPPDVPMPEMVVDSMASVLQ